MHLRVLRYFLTVVEEESISKAAEVLKLSQPTLSRQLMDLEQELNVKLFVRGNRKHRITLTEKGRILHRRASELLGLANTAISEITDDESSVSGKIKIGTLETTNIRFFSKVVSDFCKIYPKVSFDVINLSYREIRDGVDKGTLDFGVFIETFSKPEFDYVELPHSDLIGFMVPKDHEIAKRGYVQMSDIYTHPLIVHRERLNNRSFKGLFEVNFEALNIVGTFNELYTAIAFVESGLGVAVAIDKISDRDTDKVVFVPFKPLITRELSLGWKTGIARSHADELFTKVLKEACAKEGRDIDKGVFDHIFDE